MIRLKHLLLPIALLWSSAGSAQPGDTGRPLTVTPASALLPAEEEQPEAKLSSTRLADGRLTDIRLATGIVTVITAEQIEASGATDLMGALRLVPGFTLARDVEDVLGVGIRGIWAHEGKCQFMLNGVMLNDPSFGIFALGDRLPLENVARIEVISGPGSVMYGGMAALGVVNVVTKTADQEQALQLSAIASTSSDPGVRLGRMHLHGTNHVGTRTAFGYSVNMTSGDRFRNLDTTIAPDMEQLSDLSDFQTLNGTIVVQRRGFTGQFHASDHDMDVSSALYQIKMRLISAAVSAELLNHKRTQVELRAGYRYQLPWHYSADTIFDRLALNTIDQRYQLGLFGTHALSKGITFVSGLEGFHDRSRLWFGGDSLLFETSGSRVLSVSNLAGMGELRADGEHGHLVIGIRAELHSIIGPNWAPRIGYIHQRDRWHAKLLAGRAFKTPTLQNIDVGPDTTLIRPEGIWTCEAELGMRLGETGLLRMAGYSVSIDQPIVYVFEEATYDNYLNRPRAGTSGLELVAQVPWKKWSLFASAGTYRVNRSETDIPESEIAPDASAYQAMPSYTAAMALHVKPMGSLNAGFSLLYNSAQQAYVPDEAAPEGLRLATYPSTTLININARYQLPFLTGAEIGIGCTNLFDQQVWFASPYNNGERPLPQHGRTFTFRINYRLPL